MSLEPQHQVRNEKNVLQFILFFTISLLGLFIVSGFLNFEDKPDDLVPIKEDYVTPSTEVFGLNTASYSFNTHIIKPNQFLGQILSA